MNHLSESIPEVLTTIKPSIKLSLSNSNVYFADVTDHTEQFKNENNGSPYRVETIFVNNSYKQITVSKRDGMAVTVHPVTNIKTPNFIIRQVYTLNNKSMESAIASIASIKDIDSNDLLYLKSMMVKTDFKKYATASISVDFPITVDELNKYKDTTVYHYQTDALISLKSSTEIPAHPFSNRFLDISSFGIQNDYVNQTEFNLKIRYVNHDTDCTPKYLNLAGQVFVLLPQKDAPFRTISYKQKDGTRIEKTYSDYIQLFYSSRNDPSSNIKKGLVSTKYTLEEAKERFCLYDTYIDAINSGGIEEVKRKQLLKIESEIEVNKLKYISEKAITDRQSDQRKAELETIKVQLAQERNVLDQAKLKQEAIQSKLEADLLALSNQKALLEMQRKSQDSDIERMRDEHQFKLKQEQAKYEDHYNNRAISRKDTLDIVKFVPGVVIAIAGIAAIYLKMSDNQA